MKVKLAEYLTGWMGGPPLYADKYGTVCMTSPHEPYHIGPQERDQWLLCMDKALEQTGASDELVAMLKVPMFRIADAVRNKEGPSTATTDPNVIAAG
jgi:hemoglobin